MAASSIEDLRSKLKGLADMLGGGAEPGVAVAVSVSPPRPKPRPATAAAPPAARHLPPPPRQFQPTVRPSSSVLQAANAHARDAPIGGLLAKYKDAEQAWLKEKGRLQMAVKAEQHRRVKAEGELRRVQDQLAYRLGEVKHLKEALRGRDGRITALEDSLRAYELEEGGERTAQETVRQAEAERDELRASMQELLARLSAANGVISKADDSMQALAAQLEEAVAARRLAEEEAAAARQEAESLREAVSDLQFRTGLLQQLSDLQLHQNDEKTATLRALLQSETLLDATGGSDVLAGSSDSEDGHSQ
ncbi:Spindle pole body associated [Chlorella sorokiniana]|uniref:Spindle pole body associated n=1 Tax=Chlorella sorokiniana TaxID=3076 RepID=A0A2P6TQG3_CHLSO|nr:Spindle pole body associated [Chlorella sorokiniana]|eukprot:PRW56275.1 Spindle pole body associated [Chlorella sorokiniana]